METLFQKFFRSFLSEESTDPNILKGVVVCEEGEAKGHGFLITKKFLEQVVAICSKKAIKVRMDHPEEGKSGKVLSIVGQAINFRIDGDKVRADIKLFDVPAKSVLMQLAKEAGHLFGMSLDFIGKAGKKLKDDLKEVFCTDVNAVDFVESPAAADTLFQQKVDSHKKGESKKTKNFNLMNITVDANTLAALGLEEGCDEKEVMAAILNAAAKAGENAELDDDEKGKKKDDDEDSKMDEGDEDDEGKKGKEEKAAAYSKGKKGEKVERLDEKKISEIVAREVAKSFTALLAKTGAKPKVGGSSDADDLASKEKKKADENFGFNAEEVAFAQKHKIDLKSWRETLSKAEKSSMRFQSK